MPEYADTAVRLAEVVFERRDDQIEIPSTVFFLVQMDASGRIDRDHELEHGQLIVDDLFESTFGPTPQPPGVVDAVPRLRTRQLRERHHWIPSPVEREAVLSAFHAHMRPKPRKPTGPRLRIVRGGRGPSAR